MKRALAAPKWLFWGELSCDELHAVLEPRQLGRAAL